MSNAVDAVVVGAGPNGLAAAITLARAGRTVTVFEAGPTPGGGMRSAELCEPGFVHDICSAVHVFAPSSPFMRSIDLEARGVRWRTAELALAHPLDHDDAAWVEADLDATIASLGADGRMYERWVAPTARHFQQLAPELLGPPLHVPRRPLTFARFGLAALASASFAVRGAASQRWPALFAGCAAHAIVPLDRPLTASFGIALLAAGHADGWPLVEGGSQVLADALVAELESLGGTIECGRRVQSMADLPPHRAVLFDLTPRQVAAIAGAALPHGYKRRLDRFAYGPGVWKVDYTLDEPVPWRNEACRRALTVHVGGTFDAIARAEAAVASGHHAPEPFVLVVQPTVCDPTRAPAGKHTLWAYCHVPSGSTVDATESIERQIERFAPGFRDVVRQRHTMGPGAFEAYNANYIGGDITGGTHSAVQVLARPVLGVHRYQTPNPALLLCSASTPPGAGVHGMCGDHAARAALRGVLR